MTAWHIDRPTSEGGLGVRVLNFDGLFREARITVLKLKSSSSLEHVRRRRRPRREHTCCGKKLLFRAP